LFDNASKECVFLAWWIGSLLDIHEARQLVPHQNATTLQVAISITAGTSV
jgi:homospermidine synthase